MAARRIQHAMLMAALLASTTLGAGHCRARTLSAPTTTYSTVGTGIDVLKHDGFALLRGKRVGLITNQTGRTFDNRRTVDVLAAAEGVELVALFAPEHGWEGQVTEGRVGETIDAKTGLKVHSLYGQTRRPTEEMLKGIDVLVFDIQDAGVRYYTYATTMAYAMEEAAKAGVAFVVLDRPNPLNGARVDGPLLDADRLNFEGYYPLPLRHGMTIGELARLYNAENRIGVALEVVPMKHWRREQWFDQTGLRWVTPSPALVGLSGNTLYPAVELLRAGDVSVGRGTEEPFEMLGAPWIDAEELARYLEERKIPGVTFNPAHFTPTSDVHADRRCLGVRLALTDREALDAGRLGVELLSALWKLYPSHFRLERTIRLVGSSRTMARIRAGDDPAKIVEGWREELEAFRKLRATYLLYD